MYLSVDTWVVSIAWLLWIMLQWTYECKYLFNILISVLLDIDPQEELLNHIEALFLIFGGTSTLFSISTIVLCIPTNSTQVFQFTPSLLPLIPFFITTILAGFNLHFSDNVVEYLSVYTCWVLACFTWSNVCLSPLPTLNQVYLFTFLLLLSYRNPLYVLEINPLLDILFENIFFHCISCFFIVLIVSFAM